MESRQHFQTRRPARCHSYSQGFWPVMIHNVKGSREMNEDDVDVEYSSTVQEPGQLEDEKKERSDEKERDRNGRENRENRSVNGGKNEVSDVVVSESNVPNVDEKEKRGPTITEMVALLDEKKKKKALLNNCTNETISRAPEKSYEKEMNSLDRRRDRYDPLTGPIPIDFEDSCEDINTNLAPSTVGGAVPQGLSEVEVVRKVEEATRRVNHGWEKKCEEREKEVNEMVQEKDRCLFEREQSIAELHNKLRILEEREREIRGASGDMLSLSEQLQNEKATVSRAVAQNKQLKEQIIETEDRLIALTQEKLESELARQAAEYQVKQLHLQLEQHGNQYQPSSSPLSTSSVSVPPTKEVVTSQPSLTLSNDELLKVEQWEVNPSAPLPSKPSIGGGSCAPTIRGSPVPGAGPQKENVYGVGTGPMLDEETRSKSGETIKFVADIQEQVESMENRIRSNVARGRPIINDTAIQGLYTWLTELHAHVLQRMNEFDVQRTYFESLQDHLGHITEARSAIDALREEEERKRAELAAQEQQMRQAQMQHKLGVVRQQKHDILMYQRQVALQRFHQQEADMAARRQQQQAMPHQYYGYQTPTSMPPVSGYAPGGQPPAYSAYQQSYGMPPQQQGAYPGYAPVQQQQQQQHGATPTSSMQQQSATPPVSGYNQQPAQHQQQSNGYNAQVAAQQQQLQYHQQQPQQAALPQQQQQPANGYHQAQQPTGAPGAQVHQAPNNAYPQQQQPAQVAPSSHSVTPVVQSTGSPYPAASAAPAAYAPPPASLVQYAAQAVAHQHQHHTPQPGAVGGYEQQGQQPPQYTQQQQQYYQQQQQFQQQHPTSPPYQPQQQQPAAPAQSYAAPPVAAVQQPPAQEEMLISFD